MPPTGPKDPNETPDLGWLQDEPFVPTEPVRAFLTFLASESANLRKWMPSSAVADALDHVRSRLTADLQAALHDEAWLTVSEAAALARVSPDAIRDWIRKEKVRAAQRASGTYLVERRSVVLAQATSRRRHAS